jgi:hypothetical protein
LVVHAKVTKIRIDVKLMLTGKNVENGQIEVLIMIYEIREARCELRNEKCETSEKENG